MKVIETRCSLSMFDEAARDSLRAKYCFIVDPEPVDDSWSNREREREKQPRLVGPRHEMEIGTRDRASSLRPQSLSRDESKVCAARNGGKEREWESSSRSESIRTSIIIPAWNNDVCKARESVARPWIFNEYPAWGNGTRYINNIIELYKVPLFLKMLSPLLYRDTRTKRDSELYWYQICSHPQYARNLKKNV